MPRILIVDDDDMLRAVLGGMLTRLGHEICEADNGTAAQQQAIHWQPDVIFLDFMLPVQDGCTVCRNLRRKGYKGHVIMMSSLNPAGHESGVCGASSFLRKPITSDKLQHCLDALALKVQA